MNAETVEKTLVFDVKEFVFSYEELKKYRMKNRIRAFIENTQTNMLLE